MTQSCEVSSDPQAIANEYVVPVEYNDEDRTTVMMPNPPVTFSSLGRRGYTPSGAIGQDTVEVLRSLGYTEEKIAQMQASGAVR